MLMSENTHKVPFNKWTINNYLDIKFSSRGTFESTWHFKVHVFESFTSKAFGANLHIDVTYK